MDTLVTRQSFLGSGLRIRDIRKSRALRKNITGKICVCWIGGCSLIGHGKKKKQNLGKYKELRSRLSVFQLSQKL